MSTRSRDFLAEVDNLRGQGFTESQIAQGFGITTTALRAAKTIAVNRLRQDRIAMAQKLKDKGYSNVAIGQRMGINESSVRSLLAPGAKDKTDVLIATSDMLKREVEAKKYIDIGRGVETGLPIGTDTAAVIGISKEKLNTAVAMLQEEGYKVHYVKVQQVGTGEYTTRKVLSGPDVPYSEVYENRGQIRLINESTPDHGRTYVAIRQPTSIDSKRVAVRYAEDGGAEADGVIYLRRGVDDVSLGKSHYAQVRISVDGTHYLKGMAIYKDDLPDGVDIVYNVNKKNTGNKFDAFKEAARDLDGNVDVMNPFGAEIKRQQGALNIISEEGDWDTWSRNLSSQVLSKQSPALAKAQLKMTYERRLREYDEISSLTNPVVRKKLLETFADETDAAAVHLKAAELPGQSTRIILPVSSLSPNQIHAPTYPDGTRVALIRFPHAGTFEIPELTVNNRNREARRLFGANTKDAVGINPKVAERLSGADFDGDFVLVIPNNHRKIKSSPPLEGLRGFDPIRAYPSYEGMPVMSKTRKQTEMGKVTNLIADMSLRGASSDEMARAVRHSMVVIDAEKHKLDYRRSEQENGISALREKYQRTPGKARAGGASTIITRATAEKRIPERRLRKASEGGPIDPATGKRVFVPTGATYVDRTGKTRVKTTVTTQLADTDDARTLSSGHPMEKIYADHSNRLKSLANQARKQSLEVRTTPLSKEAKARHAAEVASLNAKLNIAKKNAPLERQAQTIADTIVRQKKAARPDLEPSEIKKIKNQALAEARGRTGAGKQRIQITDKEWDAIQAGAISTSKLSEILDNSDLDRVRRLATPRVDLLMTPAKTARAKQMAASGATQAEIASALGVSLTTLKNSIN